MRRVVGVIAAAAMAWLVRRALADLDKEMARERAGTEREE